MKRAYRNALSMIVQGSLICQAIDKQRELDRFLARQQGIKARQHPIQTAKQCGTTATTLSADIGLSHGEANHV